MNLALFSAMTRFGGGGRAAGADWAGRQRLAQQSRKGAAGLAGGCVGAGGRRM